MIPIDRMKTIEPAMPLMEAMEMMGQENINQLPVMSQGVLQGIISRDHIIQFMVMRAELNM